MIETPSAPTTPDVTPTERAMAWLHDFEAALVRPDIEAATRCFLEICYWRDLVAFTWNITTLEGRDGIRAMLDSTLARVMPHGFALTGDATTADGVTEAWCTFETEVARGTGLVRLKDGGAWTFLTAMTELKGFEERAGATREKGVEHGIERGRKKLARTQVRAGSGARVRHATVLRRHRRWARRHRTRRAFETSRRADDRDR